MNSLKKDFFYKNQVSNKLFSRKLLVRKFNSKKAITTTVFSWIFMSIIGGVIMMSVYSILSTYWAIEQENNNIEFAKALTNTLNVRGQSLGISSGTLFSTIQLMGNREINLECIEGEFTRMNLEGTQIIYEPLNEYLDNFAFVMPPLERELPQNIYLILENFNFPMPITPLVAIVPKSHIIIFNETNSQTNQVFNRIINTRTNFRQLSIRAWNLQDGSSDLSEDEMKRYLDSLNPSSVIFVDFNENFIHGFISEKFSTSRIPVFHVKSNFTRSPSYIDITNQEKIIRGEFRYTFSNMAEDFQITNQNNDKEPFKFNFYDTDDEISILIFGLFSTPNNFKCTYSSLIQRSEFKYQLAKNKIDIMLREEDVRESFCDTENLEVEINESYINARIYLNNIFTNRTHNLFTTQGVNVENSIIDLRNINVGNLNPHNCQLVY